MTGRSTESPSVPDGSLSPRQSRSIKTEVRESRGRRACEHDHVADCEVQAAAFSPDGTQLATAGQSCPDPRSGERIDTIPFRR